MRPLATSPVGRACAERAVGRLHSGVAAMQFLLLPDAMTIDKSSFRPATVPGRGTRIAAIPNPRPTIRDEAAPRPLRRTLDSGTAVDRAPASPVSPSASIRFRNRFTSDSSADDLRRDRERQQPEPKRLLYGCRDCKGNEFGPIGGGAAIRGVDHPGLLPRAKEPPLVPDDRDVKRVVRQLALEHDRLSQRSVVRRGREQFPLQFVYEPIDNRTGLREHGASPSGRRAYA